MKKWLLFMLPAFLLGCSSFEEEFPPQDATASRTLSSVVAEEPAQDPYSLDIMRQAVDSVALKTRGRAARIAGSQIQPTHRYVRFSPTTEDQFNALFDQSEFDCYNFRLDETSTVTEEEGCRFSPASDTPEELYAVMRTTVVLPDTIAWELLKEFYDPAVAPEGEANSTWADQVVAQARAQSQPFDPDIDPPFPGFNAWRPSGKITVWDDVAGKYIPIEGVTITIAYYADIAHMVKVKTRADGTFTSTQLLPHGTKVNYALSWDDAGWMIKSSRTSSAGISQLNMSGPWNLNISSHPTLAHATIYRAADRYWYKMPAHGLTPPNFGRKVRIVNYDAKPIDKAGTFTSAPDFSKNEPDIQICGQQNIAYLLGVVAHELGHAAHFSFNPSYYRNTNKFIKESWAQFAEFILTECEYTELGVYDHLHHFVYLNFTVNGRVWSQAFALPDNYNQQDWYLDNNVTTHRIYSPLFIDLYDDFNQREWYATIQFLNDPKAQANPNLPWIPDDNISIPEMREIQEMAFGSQDSGEAGYWILQYATRHGYDAPTISRFWNVYTMLGNEDSY